ncbi:MAG: GNAT family N-acetyltransferase [Saprospiraceae bacterium]|jgi:putative acetyltransferase|nr:GNAT family N-acetyltransferase [Saprospiraceae bacterium]
MNDQTVLPPSADDLRLRLIQAADNQQVANVIRTVMTEFGAVGQGYSIMDPEVDDMHGAYSGGRSAFYVVAHEKSGEVLGCGGIGPLSGGDAEVCELKKMYFRPELRGLGFGQKMVAACLAKAKELGYRQCYLETLVRMEQANRLYQKMGFEKICGPMGATGHGGCDSWYVKAI